MRAASMREWVSGRPRWRSRWVRSPPSNTRSGWKPFETGCTRASFLAVACTSFTGDASLDDRRAAIDSGVPLRSSVYRGRTPSHDATGGGVIDFPQHPGHHPSMTARIGAGAVFSELVFLGGLARADQVAQRLVSRIR